MPEECNWGVDTPSYCYKVGGGSDTLHSKEVVTMATSELADRDQAATVLRQALRRLNSLTKEDSLTEEKQIKTAMALAEQQFTEAIRLHV